MNRNIINALTISLLNFYVLHDANAVTMVSSDFTKICANASQILHAKVKNKKLIPGNGAMSSPVMCYELEVIYQMDRGQRIANPRICYLGDLQSDNKLVVAGLKYPTVGEVAVFFVKDVNDSTVISPLLGWNQGHFIIKNTTDQQESVFTAGDIAVCGFDQSKRSRLLNGEAADGLILSSDKEKCSPISLETFKKKVQQCRK